MERLRFLKKLKVSERETKKIFSFESLLFYSIHPSIHPFIHSITIDPRIQQTIQQSLPSLPFRIIVLIERDFSPFQSIIAQYSLHSLFQYIAETFVVPLTEPNLNSVVDLFLIRNRFVNHTSARYVIPIVKTFTDQTQNHCFPNIRQLRVILFYTITIIITNNYHTSK